MVRSPELGVSPGANRGLPVEPTLSRILAEIERDGSISFSRYMELALYEPDLGFYSTGRGAGVDFVTSPEISPLFGCFIAAKVIGLWKRLSGPPLLHVIELGGASGTLARQIACFLGFETPARSHTASIAPLHVVAIRDALGVEPPRDPPRLCYEIVDPGAAVGGFARQDLTPSGDIDRLVSSMEIVGKKSISEVSEVVDGAEDSCRLVIANEVFDNIPSPLFLRDRDEIFELRVTAEDDHLLFGELKAISDLGGTEIYKWSPVAETPIEFQKRLSSRLAASLSPLAQVGVDGSRQTVLAAGISAFIYAGGVLIFDLADNPHGTPVVTYAGHHQGFDPFEKPGYHDVMVPVRWERIRSVFEESGFYVSPSRTQAEWLALEGMGKVAEALSEIGIAKPDVAVRGRGGDLSRLQNHLQARSLLVSAKALTDPEGLGAHAVLEASISREGSHRSESASTD